MNYLAHGCQYFHVGAYARVKFVDLFLRVTKMARAEAHHAAFQSTLDGQPFDKQPDEEDLHLKARGKTVIVRICLRV